MERRGLPTFAGSCNNLVSNNTGGNGLPSDDVIAATDPKLTALADNGGPTETMALESGSPAIGAGTTVYYDYPADTQEITADQRGLPVRPPPSIGA